MFDTPEERRTASEIHGISYPGSDARLLDDHNRKPNGMRKQVSQSCIRREGSGAQKDDDERTSDILL